MQAKLSGPSYQLYDPSAGPKRSLEWNLDDWKWDGHLFIANPLNEAPSDDGCGKQLFPMGPGGSGRGGGGSSHSSTSCSEELILDKGKGVADKRRRVIELDGDVLADEAGSLTLKLGGHVYTSPGAQVSNLDSTNCRRTEQHAPVSNRAICQVENCVADLGNAKDYHRRHRVCEMHAKASNAIVGNVVQRFCQQCSRFHLLQEFDEGKRSCRRRLAGHNKRRRKIHPDANIRDNPVSDERASSYLLITLLKILSNLHSNNAGNANDQDLINHLLRNLATVGGACDGRQLSGLLPATQDMPRNGASVVESLEKLPLSPRNGTNHVATGDGPPRTFGSTSELKHGSGSLDLLLHHAAQSRPLTVASLAAPDNGKMVPNGLGEGLEADHAFKSSGTLPVQDAFDAKAETNRVERTKLWSIDLNNIYNDSEDCANGSESSLNPANCQTVSVDCPQWALQESHQLSPPQTSGNSDSASPQSPSSSNGDAQSRTDRIVFKLFGKDPSQFPLGMRSQILEWLSNSPTDIESYIRPGCIILTLYLRLTESTWEELCCNLSSSLRKLLELSSDSFWQTGWIYARIHQQIAFIYDGQVVLDTRLLVSSECQCRITSVTPIAVPVCEQVNFTVKGINFSRSSRLLCALEGNYIVQEPSDECITSYREHDAAQVLSFSCSLPHILGRGFVEVEDHGLSCGFFPFIVVEKDMVSEIRSLECAIDADKCDQYAEYMSDKMSLKDEAFNFLHEMGWLLRRSSLRSTLGQIDSGPQVFSLARFKWLLEFSMDHDWCAVVKKLLDVLFEGTVNLGGHSSLESILLEMDLLHKAVRRNCGAMVQFLLRYVPAKKLNETGLEVSHEKYVEEHLFRPDMTGPAGMTPLHIAASRDNAEMVLDALTDDPGQVGIGAWKTAYDSSGFAPEDYARLRGYFSYIHLVQRKTKKNVESGHLVLDIPGGTLSQPGRYGFDKLTGFQVEKNKLRALEPYCKACDQQHLIYCNASRSLVYRPVMLSLVAIAAVCVCVALIFRNPPEVLFVFPPFRWERLRYGSI